MLAQLTIRDIVLIDRLDLKFEPGMTVLTGETGAGKSILLDSLTLALGGRGDGGLVRHNEKQGQVTAVFDLPPGHPVWGVAHDLGLEPEGALILRRVQSADGRTRCYVNDAPVSAQALRDIGATLVEIHGQYDNRALVDPAAHRSLLDAFGGLTEDAEATRAAHAAYRRAVSDCDAQKAASAKAAAEADYLRHACEELEALAPEPGEEASLAERRTVMQQSGKVAGDLRDAFDSVAGDGSPLTTLSSAMRRLERRASQAPNLIDPGIKALDAVLLALDGAAAALEQALRDADFDPRELEQVEERLFGLRAAARKFQVDPDALSALAAKFEDELGDLDAGEARLAGLEADVIRLKQSYDAVAARLSAGRHATAATLDTAVEAELGPLKLDKARFHTQVEPLPEGGPDGIDRVEFWVSTNPGSRPGPLTKVASGGELARFMLALKVVLADRGSAPTLVFDEIDTGVGGAVADAIGQRLARLAERVQVLTVTHAPQVAARSAGHLKISKGGLQGDDKVVTRVAPLEGEARHEEIARMLAGATVTEEARAAARRLLQVAG
ncbi:DNA repair protein RecN [Lichenihabitans sp. Uapishka_5]|uniref:DNA repair protein RecN n=1 Tax=Lichenihabitans sp. Uapishka_5 TaxID=3037302 RepID=UPI0029E7D116|nr:DNA repair protein RecN [Lichenihabitans sp. Uapishka_5]MDX7952250.1 DNA repair protein RecN [Lichenihabitans sp. Uapishka_5]